MLLTKSPIETMISIVLQICRRTKGQAVELPDGRLVWKGLRWQHCLVEIRDEAKILASILKNDSEYSSMF